MKIRKEVARKAVSIIATWAIILALIGWDGAIDGLKFVGGLLIMLFTSIRGLLAGIPLFVRLIILIRRN